MSKRSKSKQTQDYKKLSKDSGSEDDAEEIDLFVRNKPPRREIPTIDKEVEEGDTLQSLAIRYHCTIEDLKRLNNIHKENEIFAKRIIKVPHRPFTMALASVHISGNNSPKDTTTTNPVDPHLLNVKLSKSLATDPNSVKKDSEVNEIIFNSSIAYKPDNNVCDEVASDSLMEDETIYLLPQHRLIQAEPVVSRLNCNGADCDIPWIPLIICVLICIVAVPLIYVLYIAEHPEKFHHKDAS